VVALVSHRRSIVEETAVSADTPGKGLFVMEGGGPAAFEKGVGVETPKDLDQRRHQPGPSGLMTVAGSQFGSLSGPGLAACMYRSTEPWDRLQGIALTERVAVERSAAHLSPCPRFVPLRAQGLLSDQVADAPNPRGRCLSWVGLTHSSCISRTAGIGASFPFPVGPVEVG